MVCKELKLISGVKYPIYSLFGEHIFVSGAMRDTLTFKFDPDVVDFTEIDRLTTLERLMEKLTIVDTSETPDENGSMKAAVSEYCYSDYVIRTKCSKERELVREDSPDSPAQYKELTVITLAQRSYSEKQSSKIYSQIAENTELLTDILGGAV